TFVTAIETWQPLFTPGCLRHIYATKRICEKLFRLKRSPPKQQTDYNCLLCGKNRFLILPCFVTLLLKNILISKASHRTYFNLSFTSVTLKDTYYFVNYTSLAFFAPIQSLISPIQISFTHIQSYSHVLL